MTMNRRSFLSALAACPLCAAAASALAGPHWTYDEADKWGEIEPSFKACSGGQQSPIDLTAAHRAEIDDLKLDWKPAAFQVMNNGHTIQCNAAAGSSLTLGGETFALKQFHFHAPSEHALDGQRSAMEVHFVHAHPRGELAVVGVFMKPGAANPAFAEVMAAAPKAAGDGPARTIDPTSMLPKGSKIFRYEGSLTTPPCSEIVHWNVFESPIEVAQADIDRFTALYPMNARPLQQLNRRFLLKGGV